MLDLAVPLRTKFFTICASNYLANAVALGRSVAATHAGRRLTVFLLDTLPAEAVELDAIDVVLAETIMPITDWHHYQCFYSLLELATSIKPLCFNYVLTDDCDVAIYLDADIVLFKPLSLVLSAVQEGHEIVL